MRSEVIPGFLSREEVDSVLRDESVQEAKDKCENGEKIVWFSVDKSRHPGIFAKIERHVKLGDFVPMKWIRGNSRVHVDRGIDSGEVPDFTFLVQMHGCGKMVLGGKRVDIEEGMVFKFPGNVLHGTEGCGDECRLVMAFSEEGEGVQQSAWSDSMLYADHNMVGGKRRTRRKSGTRRKRSGHTRRKSGKRSRHTRRKSG